PPHHEGYWEFGIRVALMVRYEFLRASNHEGVARCYFRPFVMKSGFFGFTQPLGGCRTGTCVPSPIAPGGGWLTVTVFGSPSCTGASPLSRAISLRSRVASSKSMAS